MNAKCAVGFLDEVGELVKDARARVEESVEIDNTPVCHVQMKKAAAGLEKASSLLRWIAGDIKEGI